ncbi:tripartite tricarboxylate transporter substrate binding protein [Alginatibacterium sediminis]|uniref:Tripartite tricarboxylate transporter substrate binding protein n=1 Tax=Alginatibacterium sediminis TaxID=2164068 RepID=A0A420EHZ1_9ALTE|nr:tripartite tricarboxylate transporter substrate binding protein [Alginatibacterium sediminis]RKF20277.1 tripartite tricarboxylate transporter substrate binding protein [Alginatibacterium sediminis]
MKKLITLASAALISMAAQAGDFPERNITTVVTWGAGGGTDTMNRLIMGEMAPKLGVNINVVNVTGGVSGSAGLVDGYGRAADGYSLVGLSESNVAAGVMGGWSNRMDVFDYFIVAGSPDLISVSTKTDYKSIEDLVTAAKANPGSIKAGAAGAGSIHHLNLLAFMKGTQTEFNFIPYDGSAPSQNAVLTGEVELVITSLAEQSQLIQSGDFRPLAMLVKDPVTVKGNEIPSALAKYDDLNQYLPISQSIGFAIRKDAPKDAKVAIAKAFTEAMETEKVKTFLDQNYYVASGQFGKEANATFSKLEALFAWTLADLGAAKVSPDSLGIAKPN